MASKIKQLRDLVEDAVRKIKKLEKENERLAAELDFFRQDAAKFQKLLQEHQALLKQKEKTRKTLEKIFEKLEKAEGFSAEPEELFILK